MRPQATLRLPVAVAAFAFPFLITIFSTRVDMLFVGRSSVEPEQWPLKHMSLSSAPATAPACSCPCLRAVSRRDGSVRVLTFSSVGCFWCLGKDLLKSLHVCMFALLVLSDRLHERALIGGPRLQGPAPLHALARSMLLLSPFGSPAR